jgi:branched-chain amino acid transport system permease protein
MCRNCTCPAGGFIVCSTPSEEEHVAVVDRQLQVYADWDGKQRERIKALITDELIAEHEARPLGQHSDALQRVLGYFRRQPQRGKYIIVAVRPWEEYRIGVLTGVRGQPARLLEDSEAYPTEEAAMHGIFLRRVRDLTEA